MGKGPKECPLLGGCPLLGVSFIGGSTVECNGAMRDIKSGLIAYFQGRLVLLQVNHKRAVVDCMTLQTDVPLRNVYRLCVWE